VPQTGQVREDHGKRRVKKNTDRELAPLSTALHSPHGSACFFFGNPSDGRAGDRGKFFPKARPFASEGKGEDRKDSDCLKQRIAP